MPNSNRDNVAVVQIYFPPPKLSPKSNIEPTTYLDNEENDGIFGIKMYWIDALKDTCLWRSLDRRRGGRARGCCGRRHGELVGRRVCSESPDTRVGPHRKMDKG